MPNHQFYYQIGFSKAYNKHINGRTNASQLKLKLGDTLYNPVLAYGLAYSSMLRGQLTNLGLRPQTNKSKVSHSFLVVGNSEHQSVSIHLN